MGFNPIIMTGVTPDPSGSDVQEHAGEFVLLENLSDTTFDIGGWFIRDAKGATLVIPFGTAIAGRSRLRVYTGRGKSGTGRVFANRRRAVFNNPGDTVALYDRFGTKRQTFRYGAA